MSFRRVWLPIAIGAVLLAGCRVDTRVDVTMHGDGSGVLRTTVTLDSDAVQRIGGQQAATNQLPLADLHNAGWTVDPWKASADGSGSVAFTSAFANQAQLSQRLHDLVGAHGALRDPHITRDHGWFAAKDGVSLVVDMRAPTTGIGSDADLQARLRAAGVDPATLDAQMTAGWRSALHLSVVVHLPNGQSRTYVANSGTLATFSATHATVDYDRMIKYGIAATLALLAASFFLAASMATRRDRRRRAERSSRIEQERAPLM